MSPVSPANAKSRQMTSGEAHTVAAQTNSPVTEPDPLLTPSPQRQLLLMMGDGGLGIKAYPSVGLRDSPSGKVLNA